jgi:hypothetical protein
VAPTVPRGVRTDIAVVRPRRTAHKITNSVTIVGVALALETLAWIAAGDGAHRRAARLLGAAGTQWRATGQFLYGVVTYQAKHQACEDLLHTTLKPADFDAEFARGGNLTLRGRRLCPGRAVAPERAQPPAVRTRGRARAIAAHL